MNPVVPPKADKENSKTGKNSIEIKIRYLYLIM